MFVSRLEQALEVLENAYPATVYVGDIASAIGDKDSQQVSTALSKALTAGDERFVRTDRGVYRYAKVVETRPPLDEVRDDEATDVVQVDEMTEEPPRKEQGRIRRVRQRIKDLEYALDDLSSYMTKVEAKARAYDKIQYAMNGVVVDPL
jgi:prefoldin subunit 5